MVYVLVYVCVVPVCKGNSSINDNAVVATGPLEREEPEEKDRDPTL